jgi:hypothetical protein
MMASLVALGGQIAVAGVRLLPLRNQHLGKAFRQGLELAIAAILPLL